MLIFYLIKINAMNERKLKATLSKKPINEVVWSILYYLYKLSR